MYGRLAACCRPRCGAAATCCNPWLPGPSAAQKVRQRAAKHASELVSTLDIKGEVAREAQGQESAAFKEASGRGSASCEA